LADQRLFQKSVNGHLEFLAKRTSRMADVPAVVMQYIEIRISYGTDGIEVTGNRLFPIDFAVFIGLFYRAFSDTVFPGYISTFLMAVHTGGCEVTVSVGHVRAGFFYGRDSLFGHIWLHFRIYSSQDGQLILLKGRPCVTRYATCTAALPQVADKLFFN